MSNPTTPFSWQMPTNTDLVTDLPADFEVFGQAVATSMQDLLGGTTGQVLKKNTDADMDFVWSADAAGMTNPMTTTGDVIYSSPGSTPVRLGIGSAGQVMTVASGVPSWATASAFIPILTPQNSGSYLNLLNFSTGTDEATMVEDRTCYAPIFLPGIAFDRIAIRTGSGFSGTSTVRLGLYNASSTTGKPTTVYFDAGTVSCTAADTEYTITISQTPPAGYYFLAANVQTIVGTAQFLVGSGSLASNAMFQSTAPTSTGQGTERRFTETGITGAFATAGTVTKAIITTTPVIALRIT